MNARLLQPTASHRTTTPAPRYLYTLGSHEAGSVALAEALVALDVTIVDIRLSAVSERVGWQGWWLAERYGRYYWHVPELGSLCHRPSTEVQLADPERGLAKLLAKLADGEALALLCGCPTLHRCHRRVVAQMIQQRLPRVQVIHLPVATR